MRFQNERYSIGVIEVSKGKVSEPNKELAALTRISGGAYDNLYPGADNENLLKSFCTDNIFWIRAVIPGLLLDGSVRQMDISDGVHSLQFDVKVPVFNPPASETQSSEPASEALPAFVENSQATAETTPISEASLSDTDDPFLTNYTMVIYIGCGLGAVIAITIMIVVIIISRKKKKVNVSHDLPNRDHAKFDDKTELLTDFTNDGDRSLCIRLKNRDAADQVWTAAIGQGILIGRRSTCQICVDESSVSREQCRIFVNGGAMVENLSLNNITKLNGLSVQSAVPLKSGDALKCGRVTLIVDSVFLSDSYTSGELNKMTAFVNV